MQVAHRSPGTEKPPFACRCASGREMMELYYPNTAWLMLAAGCV